MTSFSPFPPPAAAPAPGPFLDGQLCFALYASSLAMTKLYRPLLAPLGLTYPQYVVMLALWEHGVLSVGTLGERVALDSGTLAPLLGKLAAKGWVERRRSARDDRSVLISPTPASLPLRERAHAVQERVACATRFTDEQRQALMRSLHDLRSALLQGAPGAPISSASSLPDPPEPAPPGIFRLETP